MGISEPNIMSMIIEMVMNSNGNNSDDNVSDDDDDDKIIGLW